MPIAACVALKRKCSQSGPAGGRSKRIRSSTRCREGHQKKARTLAITPAPEEDRNAGRPSEARILKLDRLGLRGISVAIDKRREQKLSKLFNAANPGGKPLAEAEINRCSGSGDVRQSGTPEENAVLWATANVGLAVALISKGLGNLDRRRKPPRHR
jgi:hypothetical protein